MPHAAVSADDEGLTVPVASRITYDKFLATCDSGSAEWIDGEVRPMSPSSKRHQLLADFLTALLRHYCEARQLGVVLEWLWQNPLPPLLSVLKEWKLV